MNAAFLHPLRYWRWQRARRRLGGNWPSAALPVEAAPLLAIDLEMTGLDPVRDEIISIGWVPINAGAIDLGGAQDHRLARSERDTVGDSATIHGLRDCDLADAKSPDVALRALIAALDGRVAVFHHAPLDLAFLQRALASSLRTAWPVPVIDTLAWHRRRMRMSGTEHAHGNASTLEAACRRLGLVARSQHDALADALSCAELALALARLGHARLIEVAQPPRSGFHSVRSQGSAAFGPGGIQP
ncbi:3'-5' exonuclease [Wenzhouxiangella sediminis]|uniref:3'-5' exonuclease n=1 Tax=Wenzhouxiangella sediminis TaxID=1792836 RepID=A0A3E1KAQ5_9GAMM|nr:3'-5' exonuclease [Wenzhouxiangella sediminis]RFF31520.1 3'-5' exonuclease [Wenzhouxiangella sediminis]